MADAVFCSWPLLPTVWWLAVSSTMPRKAAGTGRAVCIIIVKVTDGVGQSSSRAGQQGQLCRQEVALKAAWRCPRAVQSGQAAQEILLKLCSAACGAPLTRVGLGQQRCGAVILLHCAVVQHCGELAWSAGERSCAKYMCAQHSPANGQTARLISVSGLAPCTEAGAAHPGFGQRP